MAPGIQKASLFSPDALGDPGSLRRTLFGDGSRISAKQMVIGDIGNAQLFNRMLDPDLKTDEMQRKLNTNLYDRGHVWWGCMGVHELPAYKAAKNNPDINATPRTYWGVKDLAYIEDRYMHELMVLGMASKFYCLSAPDSTWDPSRTPEGKHSVAFEDYTCPMHFHSRKDWRQMSEEFFDELLRQWVKYAPNMTKSNVIGHRVIYPVDIQDTHLDMVGGNWSVGSMSGSQNGRFRGTPNDYRTFIDNLYMCSSGMYGGAGIARGSSYNCYNVIAKDFGLRKPE